MGNEQHDLIWGQSSIAREVGLSEPKTKKLLTEGDSRRAGLTAAGARHARSCARPSLAQWALASPL